nr:hypothetical protein DA06_23445 [Georgenia sp. SUBG003]
MRRRRSPTVSVVIPCYNYGAFLPACVESVVAQRGVEVRVLIIDDASRDDSAAVAETLAQRHSEVTVRRHTSNRGHIATYNEGLLEWADGDYVVLLSADDRLAAGSLARSVELMEQRPDVGMVYGRTVKFADDRELPRRARPVRGTRVWTAGQWFAEHCKDTRNVVQTPSVVVRTSVQHAVGGYRPELPHAGDFDMWLRIAAKYGIGRVWGHTQAYYRVHPTSMSTAVYHEALSDVRQRKMVLDRVLSEHADAVRRHHVRPQTAYRMLASELLWNACRAYENGTVDQVPLDEWISFARETYPPVQRLRAFRALLRRQRMGEELCRRTHLFAGTAAVLFVRHALWWARWYGL